MWRAAERAGRAASLAFVNGIDRERADFAAAVESLRALEREPGRRSRCRSARARSSTGVIDLVARARASWTAGRSTIPAEAARPRPRRRARSWSRPWPSATTRCSRSTSRRASSPTTRCRAASSPRRTRGKLVPVLCGAAAATLGVRAARASTSVLPCCRRPRPRPATALARRRARGRAEPERALRGARVQDRDRPLRGHALAAARRVRHAAPRRRPS